MAKESRRRGLPDLSVPSHNTLAITGLGDSRDVDAEGVAVVSDRLTFGTRLPRAGGGSMTNVGSAQAVSDWVPCQDCSILRLKAEYREATGTRQFIVLLRDYGGAVYASGIIEPDNHGIDDGATEGYHALGFDFFDARGFADFAIIVLAGVVNVDVWGAAA